jgi:hypothetical protein
MSKLSRRLGVGLTRLGESISEKAETKRKEARVDERLAKEDAFKERELQIKEDESRLVQENLKRQGLRDEATFRHGNLVKALAAAGDNQEMAAAAYSRYYPDKRKYTLNKEKAELMKHDKTGKSAFMVWDTSYNDVLPSGEVIKDPTTGKAKQKPGPGGPMVFWTKDEYTDFLSNTLNPDAFLARVMKKQTDQQAYDTEFQIQSARDDAKAKAQKSFAKTPAGIEAARKQKADTELVIAKTGQAKRSPVTGASADKVDRITGLDGNEIELTVTQSQRLQKDTLAMSKLYEGISSGEVYRFQTAMEDPLKAQNLSDLAQEVVNEPKIEADVVKGIMKVYRMSRPSAMAILRETKAGLTSTKQPWYKTMFAKPTGAAGS